MFTFPQHGLKGFLGDSEGKASAYNAGDQASIPGSERFLGEGNGYPLQYFLPEELHGQRSLAGYSPWGHRVGHPEQQTLSLLKEVYLLPPGQGLCPQGSPTVLHP